MHNQLKLGALLSYFSLAFNIISGFLYTPWMIEQIGDSSYGLYTLANSLITLFLVDFGLGAATSRYVSKYRAEGRQDKIDSFLGAIYKLYLLIDAVIFVILFVLYFFLDMIYTKLTPAELEQFKVVYLIAASFAVINFPFVTLKGILNSYEKFIQLKLADVIYRMLLIGITVVMLLLDGGLYALVAVHAAVGLLVILYNLIVICKSTPVKINFKVQEPGLYREIFSFSIWVTVGTLAQRLIFNITPTILGITTNTAKIAVFGIVTTIEGYAYTITTAINGMFMPAISRIYESETASSDIMPLMLKVGRFQYALNGLIVAGFAVIGKQFINLWMGPNYLDAYWGILLVLIPGLFSNSLQIAKTAMIVENKVKIQAIVTSIAGIINVALSFVLSYFCGIIGACVSIFVAYMIRAIISYCIYLKVMKFNMTLFTKECFFRMSLPIVFTIISGILLNYLITDGGIITMLIKGSLVVILYLIFLWCGCLDKDEKTLILKHKE